MKNNVVRASFVVAIIGIISKIMGTVRQSLIAYSFGQSALTDAYNSAYKIAFLSTVLLNASIVMVIIPIMDKAKTKEGLEGKNRFFNNASTLVLVLNIVLSIISVIGARLLVDLVSPGFSEEIKNITVDLVRIISPSIIFLGVSICLGAYQQSNFIFAPYAAVGIINNIVFYIYLLIMGKEASIYGLGIITSLGAVAQMIFMIPFMRKQDIAYKPHLDLQSDYMKDAMSMFMPLMLLQGVAQIDVFVTNALATNIDTGMVSVLDNAYRLFSAFMNLFVMTISTVLFPLLSEAFNKKDYTSIKKMVRDGMDFIALILIPASIGVIALATPIVQVVYERGKFTALDTEMTKAALIGYAIGMLGNGLKVFYNRLFISFQDSVIPFINVVFNTVSNVLLALLLIIPLSFRGLALAQGLAGILSAVLFMYHFKKKIPDIHYKTSIINFCKLFIIAAVMGVAVHYIYETIVSYIGNSNLQVLIAMSGAILVGLVIYIFGIYLLKIDSVIRWMDHFKKKVKR